MSCGNAILAEIAKEEFPLNLTFEDGSYTTDELQEIKQQLEICKFVVKIHYEAKYYGRRMRVRAYVNINTKNKGKYQYLIETE